MPHCCVPCCWAPGGGHCRSISHAQRAHRSKQSAAKWWDSQHCLPAWRPAANPLHAAMATRDGTDRQTPYHYTDPAVYYAGRANNAGLPTTLLASWVLSAWSFAVWEERPCMQWRWCDSRPLEAATSDAMSTLVVCTSVRRRFSLQHTWPSVNEQASRRPQGC